jgi:hypothetical protein
MLMTRMFAVLLAVVFLATTAAAADRVQAGEWETTMTMGSAKPIVTKYCISADEARLMNGDEATLRKYLVDSTAEKMQGRCTVKSVKVAKNQTVVAIICGETEVVNTTDYFGDRYTSKSSTGATLSGKRLGACPKP